MLSKVFIDEEVPECAPVPWRQGHTHSGSSDKPAKPVLPHNEMGHLRGRIAELEAELETKVAQAYAAGVNAGEESARQKLEAGVREVVQQMSNSIADLSGLRSEILRRAEVDAVSLCMEIARKVLHHELSTEETAMDSLIRAALEKLQGQEIYRVRVHPDQEAAVRACLDGTARGRAVTVVADPVQNLGGAIFEISRGSLDASVETQLTEIERGLAERLEARA